MSVAIMIPPPTTSPDYSSVTSDSYTYRRVRIIEDYYYVTIAGIKATGAISPGVMVTTVPEKYRPIATHALVPAFLNDNSAGGNVNVSATTGAITMGSSSGATSSTAYVVLSGSWIHKGD
jgi:hypothetical protein